MGSYRQHLGVASFVGVLHAWAMYALAGIHWMYGSVAAVLSTLGGLLPDLDSESGVNMRGFTGMLGVLAAVAVWQHTAEFDPPPGFELHLWMVILTYVGVRHLMRRLLCRLTVHRGMCHSIPTCLAWGAATYLYYPSPYHPIRAAMALAVMLGFFSHLLLDEVCSIDLQGVRVNKAFGTAIKFWARSTVATLAVYALLAYLTWRVIQVWPVDPAALAVRVPDPETLGPLLGRELTERWLATPPTLSPNSFPVLQVR